MCSNSWCLIYGILIYRYISGILSIFVSFLFPNIISTCSSIGCPLWHLCSNSWCLIYGILIYRYISSIFSIFVSFLFPNIISACSSIVFPVWHFQRGEAQRDMQHKSWYDSNLLLIMVSWARKQCYIYTRQMTVPTRSMSVDFTGTRLKVVLRCNGFLAACTFKWQMFARTKFQMLWRYVGLEQ